jgi:hypothetical protein
LGGVGPLPAVFIIQISLFRMVGLLKRRKGVAANEFPLTLKSKYFIRELNF